MTNPAGGAVSEEVKLTVVEPVVILNEPEGGTKLFGQALKLSVVASGSEPLVYQWYKDDKLLDGSHTESVIIESLELENAGIYRVRISNEAGGVMSADATVVVQQPISITKQPVDVRVIEGEKAVFKVEANGTNPIQYEWRFNGDNLKDENDSELRITDTSKDNEGVYQIVMSNPAGSVVSEEVKLTVVQPVVILEEPEGATKLLGQAIKISVAASGSEPLNYQWYKNDALLPDYTDASLTFESLTLGDGGAYKVNISNEAGEVESAEVNIVVHQPISIIHEPEEARVIDGEEAVFNVEAAGTAPIKYEWLFNSKVLKGQHLSLIHI